MTATQRVRQIAINLARLRSRRDDAGRRQVRINIPDFRLGVIERGDTLLSMRAIVGRKDRVTPVLSSEITCCELNPTWNIPQKLLRRDVLPRILDDPDYLTEHDIRVFESWRPDAPEVDPATVRWDSIPPWNLAFKLQQQPGPAQSPGPGEIHVRQSVQRLPARYAGAERVRSA